MRLMKCNTRAFARDDSGAAMVWSIFWTIIFLLIGGFVIDTSNAYRNKQALRATADASALAAIISFTEEAKFDSAFGTQPIPPATPSERGKMAGNLLANRNMDPAKNGGTVTPESEVTMGFWTGSSFIPEDDFTSGMVVNAARVRSLRTTGNGNALDLLLADITQSAGTWDVGATSIAMTYQPLNCPSKEGIMAGGTLNFASNNIFQGDLCLHGELAIDFNTNSEWQPNSEDNYPVISFGVGGELCKGWGNCQKGPPYDNVIPFQSNVYPLTLAMIAGEQTHMPDVPQIYGYYGNVVSNPQSHTAAGAAQNRYIPDALVTNPNRDPATEDAVLVTPPSDLSALSLPAGATAAVVNGVLRITISATDFEAAASGGGGGGDCKGKGKKACDDDPAPSGGAPFPPNAVVDIDGGNSQTCTANGGGKITLTGDTSLENIVINTSCRVIFNGSNSIAGSTVLSSYSGNNAAIQGNSGAVLGDGTCDDDSRGATVIANGEVHFASGVNVRGSRVVTMSDVHIAAQGDGLRGTQIMTAGNGHFTSNGAWAGCSSGLNTTAITVDHYYKLVY